jgi:membrane protease YdiL (CAAX protease family)
VRQPKKETIYFILSFSLGFVFFYFRLSPAVDWQHLNGLVRLALLPLVLFVFPIALAIVLLYLKYKPSDLGFRLRGFILIIPIVLISAITNRIVSPDSLTWAAVVAESGGVLASLYTGLVLAGLSEEFFRLVGQTRIGAYLNNAGIGWFIATVIWAFMHAPKWYAEDPNMTEAILSSIRIIPIGLMWGYMTHRTKSILPSVIVHGTNVWGLQNF